MTAVTAIETRYGGCRFRSRLEARWAVFFTRLGLDWEYEEQGYQVGRNKQRYLPDFLLPDLGLYIEIKPLNAFLVDPEGVRRWEAFAEAVAENWGHERSVPVKHPGVRAEVAMVCGPIPDPDKVMPWGPTPRPSWAYERGMSVLGEGEWAWCACRSGRHFDIQHLGRGNRVACGCTEGDVGHTADDSRILNAYGAARSSRFEEGSNG